MPSIDLPPNTNSIAQLCPELTYNHLRNELVVVLGDPDRLPEDWFVPGEHGADDNMPSITRDGERMPPRYLAYDPVVCSAAGLVGLRGTSVRTLTEGAPALERTSYGAWTSWHKDTSSGLMRPNVDAVMGCRNILGGGFNPDDYQVVATEQSAPVVVHILEREGSGIAPIAAEPGAEIGPHPLKYRVPETGARVLKTLKFSAASLAARVRVARKDDKFSFEHPTAPPAEVVRS